MTEPLPPEVRARIETYLDAVEDRLRAADVARERRRGIADDLETQIRESLAALARPATVEDAGAVLARLDPPEAYADVPVDAQGLAFTAPVSGRPPSPARLAPAARSGAWLLLAGTVFSVMALLAFSVHSTPVRTTIVSGRIIAQTPPPPRVWTLILPMLALSLGPIALIGTTACGWTAARQIARSGGRLYGTGLAAFEALLLPTVVAYVLACLVGTFALTAYYDSNGYSDRKESLMLLICVTLGTAFTAGLVWLFLRTADQSGPVLQASVRGVV